MTDTFRDLIAWQKAKVLAIDVYRITRDFPTEERYGLTSQMRRAAISVLSNIAEGKGRGSKKDFGHFLLQARGSLYELESQVDIAHELGYLAVIDKLNSMCDEEARILNGLIGSTQSRAASA